MAASATIITAATIMKVFMGIVFMRIPVQMRWASVPGGLHGMRRHFKRLERAWKIDGPAEGYLRHMS
jgi:hypothetical protein